MKNNELPHWLLQVNYEETNINNLANNQVPIKKVGTIKRKGFIDKTVKEIARRITEEYNAEKIARQPGLLQLINPRIKILSMLYLIIICNLVHSILSLVILNIWVLLVVKLSRIPLYFFIKRVWLVVLLFTGIVVFPSIFNFVRPGSPLIILMDFGHPFHLLVWDFPKEISITKEGIEGALMIITRVGASVSLAKLLAVTTRWNVLLKALRMIFVPQLFVQILEMTHRYIYLLVQTANDMFLAKKCRTIGRTSTKKQRGMIAGSMGSLWLKAYHLSEEIHTAMISRGYSGKMRIMQNLRINLKDWAWAVFVGVIGVLLFGGEKFFV
ncbi:cobalt ECF transporter T component CbiQ [Desulforamulus aquiferis]|uniref:Cobalt ECF transporter T component CbiQ n=1 Tax=Desulforamulus aquiferis TaxID=1397668 RepID=A0AAW7ZH72_9FIRM|nr:cobalt ECF transporter T component CbiQ [Desulforamulus aquiferis]MDO7788175.1 cobalt ECF transporter T component CbiQ [Desulforamulus aquiferis]